MRNGEESSLNNTVKPGDPAMSFEFGLECNFENDAVWMMSEEVVIMTGTEILL